MTKYFCILILIPIFFSSCADQKQYANLNSTQLSMSTYHPTESYQQPKPDEGKNVYLKYCLACHQKDGSGVPGMYPPIQKSDWVKGDKKRLINILLNGLEGDITVNGESFSSAMPKQNYLSNKQIAQVLSYVRRNFGNQADSVKVKEVNLIRK